MPTPPSESPPPELNPDHAAARLSEAEQALRASDAIIAISADAIITTNEAREIIRYNQGAEDIFGYSAEEMLGQRIEVLIPERFRARHPAQVEGFAESPTVARRMGDRRQISGLRKNGQEFPAEASISKTRIGDQWIFTVALRDVTERQRAERGQRFLAQATSLLNRSLDADVTLSSVAELSIPMLGDWCVVFLAGDDGRIRRALAVHADPAKTHVMRRLTEIPLDQRPDQPLMRCMRDSTPLLIESFDDDALDAWSDGPEHRALLASLAPGSVIAVPLVARDRNMGAICFFRARGGVYPHTRDDVEVATELTRRAAMALDNARLYGEAQHAVNARDDVLAVVSHDLGNPLAAIRLSSTLLSRQLPRDSSTADAHQQVDNIRSAVQQMERLIKDLLDIKRIEAGFLALEDERVMVRDLIDDIMETFGPLTSARGVTLTRTSADETFHVRADRERLQQVFSNLLGNAIKFSSAGDTIRVGAIERGDFVEFSIADSGPGIPAEHLPHIFDRFWQARRTGRHGIGLGLAIVKGIVDAHGGSVSITSELGSGSAFTVVLPRL